MMEKLIRTANQSENPLTFEIGSNSDLILRNVVTENLPWTIEQFAANAKGKLTFPYKVRHDFAFAFSESSAEGDISYEFESGNHYQKSGIGNIEAQSAHYGIKCYV